MSALAAVASVAALGATCRPPPDPPIFVCPDVPDRVIESMPPDVLDWYMNEMDPFCERLENAADAA